MKASRPAKAGSLSVPPTAAPARPVATSSTARADVPADGGFFRFVRDNRRWALLFGFFFLAAYLLLRYWYPHMDETSDTGGYIRWGMEDQYGGTRPLGYSHFLVWVHGFSESDGAVAFLQMLLYAVVTMLQFYTVIYLFRVQWRAVLWSFFAASCIFFSGLYTTNLAMSDSVFYSLSVLLLMLCLHFVRKPSVVLFGGMLLVMMACIQLRYLGLVYPALLAVSALLALKNRAMMLGAVAIAGGAAFMYVNHVSERTEEDQGVRIFSAFGGWQKASNALHIVPYISHERALVEIDDPQVALVDSIVCYTYPVFKSKYPKPGTVSYEAVWIDSLPLRHAFYYTRAVSPGPWYPAWNAIGGTFDEWGSAMIGRYPGLFFQKYLWPNTGRAIFPPLELFEKYHSTGDPGPYEQQWFGWKPPVTPRQDAFRPLLATTPYAYPLLWMGAFAAVLSLSIGYGRRRAWRSLEARMVGLVVFFVLLYTAASVWGAPINLRFMMPVRAALLMLIIVDAARLLDRKDAFFAAPAGDNKP